MENRTKRIMMLHKVIHDLPNHCLVKALSAIEHDRLIKVLRTLALLRKEPMLDRKQSGFPAYFSLICHTTDLVHMRCQCCNRWILEQILHVQLIAGLERTRCDLDGLDGIAA
ncbi:hypothetical protein D1872_199410 [compost metagenome]